MSAADVLRDALLEAARRYYEAGQPGAQDLHGVSARLWYGAQLRLAAEAWARAELGATCTIGPP